ncbi:transposase [Bradyrhizobium sp. IC3123]|nr:transposase [Bradyrhizobium sp. IC3123]MCA1394185.1 transposase [Bradyrhizobium sp. IC3123]
MHQDRHQDRHDAVSYQRIEVITGERRRRSWSDAEKTRIVAESADPETGISEVARRNGVNRGLLSVWRRARRGSRRAKRRSSCRSGSAPPSRRSRTRSIRRMFW